jgi:hypothetical protein
MASSVSNDKLTNSIENTFTGKVFDTEIVRLTNVDIKQIKKRNGNLIGTKNLKTKPKKFTS